MEKNCLLLLFIISLLSLERFQSFLAVVAVSADFLPNISVGLLQSAAENETFNFPILIQVFFKLSCTSI